jgi:hypothetical protein
VRLERSEFGPGVGSGGECPDLELGVTRQDAQQLAARISAGPRHRHPEPHDPPLLSPDSKIMQKTG